MDYIARFNDLPRFIEYKDEVYVPIIYKHENEYRDNSLWLMYAKRNERTFSFKVLFADKAGELGIGLAMFVDHFDELCAEKKIRGREWFGDHPHSIDFWND